MPHPWLTGTIRKDEAEDRERVEAPRAEGGKVYPRGFAAMIGMLGHMQRQLPYEKMRQSTNVVDRSRAQPPPPSLADLLAGQFVPNAEYERRMQSSASPMDPLAVGAGILDIAPKGRRGFAEGGHFTVPDPDDPFKRAAARRRSQVSPRPRSTGLETLASMMIPETPLDVALMTLGGPMSRAAKTGAVALGGVLTSDEAEAGPLALIKKGIKAYHGSPHKFEKFDINKVGTGEGSQVYGHGLYFAENPEVAKTYRQLADTRSPTYEGKEVRELWDERDAFKWLKKPKAGETPEELIKRSAKDVAWMRDAIDPKRNPLAYEEYTLGLKDLLSLDPGKLKMSKGHTYEVNIRADPKDLLNLDKPMAEQPRAAINFLQERYGFDPTTRTIPGYSQGRPMTGASMMPRTAQESEKLKDIGIPGLSFFDRMSRKKGEGTSNYVIFDDSIIDILKRYGIGGLAAMPALDQMAAERGKY